MKKEKNNIAVAVNKIDKVWHDNFGISPFFQIYNSKGELIEKRINPHGAGHSKLDHDENKPVLIKEILNDCSVFIGKRMGEKSKEILLEKFNVETIFTEETDPETTVESFLNL